MNYYIYSPSFGIKEFKVIEHIKNNKYLVKYKHLEEPRVVRLDNLAKSKEEAIADYFLNIYTKANKKIESCSIKLENSKKELDKLKKEFNFDKIYKQFPEKFF